MCAAIQCMIRGGRRFRRTCMPLHTFIFLCVCTCAFCRFMYSMSEKLVYRFSRVLEVCSYTAIPPKSCWLASVSVIKKITLCRHPLCKFKLGSQCPAESQKNPTLWPTCSYFINDILVLRGSGLKNETFFIKWVQVINRWCSHIKM